MLPVVNLQYDSVEALRRDFESNLRKLRAFVVGFADLPERSMCELRIVHPVSGAAFSTRAEVVWVQREGPGAGTGLQLHDVAADKVEGLRRFIDSSTGTQAPELEDRKSRNLHERVRSLSTQERDALARQGTLPERVALERAFGASIWEALLQNPQVTLNEVARIAKSSSLSAPLLNMIVANAGWLANGDVQRALLANARVTGPTLERVLRAMPRSELERVAQQTAYRMPVRTLAKRLAGK